MSLINDQKKHDKDYGKVAVLMGGFSAEREISIETGTAVYDALSRNGIDAHQFDTAERSLLDLAGQKFDRAFIALHGRGGEDGTIQGALQTLGIPYTGSNVLGSALAMDKVCSKQVWNACNLPTPKCIELKQEPDLEKVPVDLGYPVIIKPVNEGSSVGATKVKHDKELVTAWERASAFDNRVLAEKWVDGQEFTATILQNEVLPMIRVETPREFYDYEAKYSENTTQYICPCGLGSNEEERLAIIVLSAFEVLCASGWGRIDFIIDTEGNEWLIELNTVPGMTSHSLVPMSAQQAGLNFDELVLRILQTSLVNSSVTGAVYQ